MKKSDSSVLIGIVIAFGALMLGFIMDKGNPIMMFQVSAMIMIIGGTVGATMTSNSIKDILRIPSIITEAMTAPGTKEEELIEVIVTMSEKARREGLLSLETDIESELANNARYDPILHLGLQLVVDGTEREIVKNILEREIDNDEERKKRDIKIFQDAGGFSPTMGIIGTVLGLILVLSRLSDPGELGHSIAVAFTATLWGIMLANIFWLPIANKLGKKLGLERISRELIMEGILSIQNGENPRILKDKLKTFIEPARRKAFKDE